MSKRAVLCDIDNVEIAYVSYSEMDDYIDRGLVERLSPVRSKTHRFRLLVGSTPSLEADHVSPCSLPAATSKDNAGEGDVQQVLRARRKVRAWPHVGSVKVGDHCPLVARRAAGR